jgi:quinol monooxygenase YgiN
MWTTVLQETFRPNRFVILEAWKEESSFLEHDKASHTTEFRSRLKAIHNSPYDQRVHQRFAVGEVHNATDSAALNVVTHVDVPPPRREETEVLLKRLAEESRRHEGNLRYDVFQQLAPRTNHFTVFAVWRDEKTFASHELQPQTREFREALGPMLGAPYDERLCKLLPSLGGA